MLEALVNSLLSLTGVWTDRGYRWKQLLDIVQLQGNTVNKCKLLNSLLGQKCHSFGHTEPAELFVQIPDIFLAHCISKRYCKWHEAVFMGLCWWFVFFSPLSSSSNCLHSPHTLVELFSACGSLLNFYLQLENVHKSWLLQSWFDLWLIPCSSPWEIMNCNQPFCKHRNLRAEQSSVKY